jgi:hypothetical protein
LISELIEQAIVGLDYGFGIPQLGKRQFLFRQLKIIIDQLLVTRNVR